MKKFAKVKSNIGPLQIPNQKFTADPKEMADLLANQYTRVFSVPEDTPSDIKRLFSDQKILQFKDIIFSIKDVLEEIKNTSSSAASGPDGLPIILLQKCPSLGLPLHIFWTKCWEEEVTVQSLKEPIIIPIHKGGSKGAAENYRPISLTSHVVKIFERIIRKRIVYYIESNGLFNSSQHGFRGGRPCLSQLLQHYDTIISIIESNKNANVDVVYIDFAKAFDKVDIDILLNKVSKLGIGGKLGRWLHSFLTGGSQKVMVKGIMSEASPVLSGVPQGSVLGPLLFLIFIGDIDEGLVLPLLSSFADDTRLIAVVSTLLQITNFQKYLLTVYDWAERNKMEFNNPKFELLRYWLSDDPLRDCTNYISSTGSIITEKAVVKDLGVYVSSKGNFKDHIKNIVIKVKKLVSWILRTFSCRSTTVMLTLWKTIVLPHLEYASQLWSPSQIGLIQELESLQRSFLRKIQDRRRVDYWKRLKEFKLYSLERRRERYRIIYIWKILEKHVPNLESNGEIIPEISIRMGRTCHMKKNVLYSSRKVRTLRDSSFSWNASQLFNALPKPIRDLTGCSVEKFKGALDKFLGAVPDEPQVVGMTLFRRAESNSIIDLKNI